MSNGFLDYVEDVNKRLAKKDKQIADLKARLEIAHTERHEEWKTGKEWKWEWQKVHRQLEIYKKALTLAREYMFNVMCADDVPSEDWFIECAENNKK